MREDTRRRRLWFGVLALVFAFGLLTLLWLWSTRPTLAQSQTPAGCSQLLANSDFEGTGGWREFSKLGVSLISDFPPPSGSYHSGNRGAYLADYNNARDYIAQEVTIPADATQATLTFWWQVETQESALNAYDFLTVTVDAPLGTPLATVSSLSNQNAAPAWQQTQVDLLAYRGRTITLRFEATTDANRPTAFYLDDITLDVCTGTAATPTPTPTSTPTPAPTSTPTATPAPGGGAIMALSPAHASISLANQPFTVSVVISNVVDLGGFEFTLTYDPQVVHVQSVTLGNFLGSTGRSVSALPAQIDNAAGRVAFGAFSFGPQAGPSGTGTLARIAFVPQAEGNTALTFQHAQATNTSGNVLALTTRDGTLTVTACSPYDMDCDGDIDIVDIMTVASHWGCQQGDACYDSKYDLNRNGRVDIVDIMQVASRWGCRRGDACYGNPASAPRAQNLEVSLGIPDVRVPATARAFPLALRVTGARDLAAVEATLAYDPGVLEVINVTSAGFLAQNGREEVLLTPRVDNATGRVTVGIFTYGNRPGANGDGDLLYIWVRPKALGQSDVRLLEAQAVNSQAQPDSVTLQHGQVQVLPGRNTYFPLLQAY